MPGFFHLPRTVPFINKVNLYKDHSKVINLAARILVRGHPKSKTVILGQALLPEPIFGVVNTDAIM
jgi:hypothetical protein